MGFIDLFRKKQGKIVKTVKATKKEIPKLVDKELQKNQEAMNTIKKEIKSILSNFIKNLNSQINTLNGITLEEKKEYEKIKTITLENLRVYITHLSYLSKGVEKTLSKDIPTIFSQINFLSESFRKNSEKSFDKATILIGKELEENRGTIQNFFKSISKIARENNHLITRQKKIEQIFLLRKQAKEIDSIKLQINNTLNNLNKEIEIFKLKKDEKNNLLQKLKESKDYKKLLEQKDDKKERFRKFNLETINLKSQLDLKSLLKRFHEIDKKRKLIQRYRDNFLSALMVDENLELINSLPPEKREFFGEKIKSFKKRYTQFNLNELSDVEKEESKINKEIKSLNFRKLNILQKIEEENRKLSRFTEKKESLKIDIMEKSLNILEGIEVLSE